MLLSTLAYEQKQPRRFRRLMFPCSPLWMVYNIHSGSVSGVVTEAFACCRSALRCGATTARRNPNRQGGCPRFMELHFQNPGFDYMLEQILAFQDEDASPFWSAPLYRFYPQLEPARTLPRPARLEAIARELRSVYDAQEQTIHEKTRAYAAHWQRCKPQVTAALSDAFSLDAAGLFNDLQVAFPLTPSNRATCANTASTCFISTARRRRRRSPP